MRPGDLASAAALLADAFYDNPAHVYLLPDPRARRDGLRFLLGRGLRLQLGFGQSFCRAAAGAADDPRRVDAMGIWHPPGSAPVGLAALLRHGLWLAPFAIGVGGTRRVLEIDAAIERGRASAAGGARVWYLSNMAVRESLRGSGVGTRLLAEELRERVDPSGCPATLATQRPENVRFYARLGFEVVSESLLGSGPRAFRSWLMVRPAAASDASAG